MIWKTMQGIQNTWFCLNKEKILYRLYILKKAVDFWDFEKAAVIRDQIRDLIGQDSWVVDSDDDE